MTFAIMGTLKKRNKKIPEEVGLVGFTDEFHAKLVDPTLTSITHPTLEMRRQAARMIFTQINSPKTFTPYVLELETKLIPRQSTLRTK